MLWILLLFISAMLPLSSLVSTRQLPCSDDPANSVSVELVSPTFSHFIDEATALSLVHDVATTFERCAVDDTHTPALCMSPFSTTTLCVLIILLV